jgi:hypothetical protein
VEIAGKGIIKTYNQDDRFIRIDHLRKVYQTLQNKNVPNVDSLTAAVDQTTAILFPRGNTDPPHSERELVEALICVLEALQASG